MIGTVCGLLDDDELCVLMGIGYVELLKRDCLKAPSHKSITSIEGDLGRYLTRAVTSGSSKTTSMQSDIAFTIPVSVAIPMTTSHSPSASSSELEHSEAAPATASDAIASISTTHHDQPQSSSAPPPPPPAVITQVITETLSNGITHIHTTLSTPPPSSSLPPKPQTYPPNTTATIAGAAAGGTVFLALALGSMFYILRRRKRSRSLASTPERWDPSAGGHGKPTLPDVEGHGHVGRGMEKAKAEVHGETIPNRYASHVPPVPMVKHQHTQYPHPTRHPSHTEMRFNDSPYPELETRSPPPPSTVYSASELHTDTVGSPVSELHTESVGSPVSELGGMGVVPRMGGAEMAGGAVELGDGNGRVGGGYVEMYAGGERQVKPRYYASGNNGGGGGNVGAARNF